MKKMAFPLIMAFSISLPALPAVSAAQQPGQPRGEQQAPQLYQQCLEQLQQDPNNREAKRLCDEGMRLHQQGQQEEAVRTIQEGLTKFKQ